MQFSTTIDTLIALTLFLLVLSLMAQSTLELLKRSLGLKTRLLEQVVNEFLCKCEAQSFLKAVVLDPGRTSTLPRKGSAAESLSIADLRRWFNHSNPRHRLPSCAVLLAGLQTAGDRVKETFTTLTGPARGQAGAELATLRALLEEVERVSAGTTDLGHILATQFPLEQILLRAEALDSALKAQGANAPALEASGRLPSNVAALYVAFKALAFEAQQKWGELETGFELAMTAFDERYQRSMRRWTFAVGLGVVLVFNAGFFRAAKKFHASEAAQRILIDNQSVIEQLSSQCNGQGQVLFDCLQEKLGSGGGLVMAAGFEPITLERARQYAGRVFSLEGVPRFVGDCAGWLVTTVLIGAGAPFWQDVLQALFGLKKLLRVRSAGEQPEFIAQ